MKIGVFSDVHNNIVALDAVLSELVKAGCERFICAGDIIGIGPRPEETVQRIMTVPDLISVRGNHESYLLDGMPTDYPNDERMSYDEMEHHKWEHGLLSEGSVSYLRGLPHRVDFSILGKNITVFHYPMDGEKRYIRDLPYSDADGLKRILADDGQNVVIYGHHHKRNILCHNGIWYINSGSLGCPGHGKNIASAVILEITENGNINVQDIDVMYDAQKVVCDIEQLNYPDSETIKKVFYGITEAGV